MDNFVPKTNPPAYDVDMVGDENNPEPIDARLRRPLEPLTIFAEDSEQMDTARPVAAVAPMGPLMAGDSEAEGPAGQPLKRKESEIRSAYQVEAEEEENCLSMADPYKGKGYLRLDIDKFSEFCRGEPDRQQRMSKAVWVRGLPWKILAIPRSIDRGQQRNQKALGFFLQCNGGEVGEGANWNCVASAALHVISKRKGQEPHIRRITHTFYPKENDWGYSSFMTCEQLANPTHGFIENDTVSLAVYVSAEAPHGVSWDSRKHTGFVGLKNQGATCYMNSILQTLFFTNSLRKAVYQMTMSPEEDPESSVALAMQRVFYDLSHSDKPVGTKKLTKSFGWDSLDSFLQHDVQELCRVLLDNLETKMKGTPVQDMIPTLFKGKMCSYIKCTDVDYESARDEIFYDVQLNIRSRDPSRHNTSFSIMDSFRDYVEAERLDGENKYDAGEYGLQPALKGVRFVHFPPILQFQLMRFQFDPNLESNVKVNDRFEFTDLLDLNEFVEKNDEGIDYTYYLHAVLVHSGDFHGGHYVVYINTDVKGRTSHWCKFDDDVVSRSTFRDAIVANFGGDDPEDLEVLGRIFTNAYMLVYIRKDKIDEVLCEVTDKDIPPELIERFETDKVEEEKHKKEKQDAHLYQNVYFITDEIIERHRGFDLFDVRALDTPEIHRKIEKAAPLEKLFSYVQNNVLNGETRMGEDLSFRLWKFSENAVRDERQHMMSLPRFRATDAIVLNDETSKQEIVRILQCDKAIIYIERPSPRPDGTFSFLPYNDTSDILIFLKYYDTDIKEIRCIGTTIVNFRSSLIETQPEILAKLGLPVDSKLRFYEEISPEKIKLIESPSLPLCSDMMLAEVNDGAIIIFERIEFTTMHDNAKAYIDRIYNTLDVEILQNDDNSTFPCAIMDSAAVNTTGVVDLLWRCDKLTEYVAKKLDWDPARLMLWRLAAYSEKPTHFVNEAQLRHSNFRVKELLSLTGDAIHDPRKQKKYKIFYNKIPIPVAELDRRKQMRITMVDEKFNCVEATIFPDKYGNVRSILEETKRIFKFSTNGTGKLRLVLAGTTNGNKRVMTVFHEDEPLSAVQKSSPQAFHLRVEEIPADQLSKGLNEFLLAVAHFDKNAQDRMFGVPFWIKVTEGEPFQQVRERLRVRLELSEKDIEKYKFAILTGVRVNRYLDMESDERVRISDLQHFPRAGGMDVRGVSNSVWLGLDHFNRSRGSEKARAEKAIVIHN